MGGHQSSFDPPPEGSAKCSLDLRALLDSPVVQRLHLISHTTVPQSPVVICSQHTLNILHCRIKQKDEKSLIAVDVITVQ